MRQDRHFVSPPLFTDVIIQKQKLKYGSVHAYVQSYV